jgi:predicted amidohydrolase
MQLVGVQLDIVWENRDPNFAKVRSLLERNPPKPGALVALPEMFTSGFSMNVAAIAEDVSRAIERFLCELSQRYGVHLNGGLATVGPDGRGRNEAVVADPAGRAISRYQKIHPFVPGKEAQHYAGGESIVTFPCGDFTVAPFVCYDLRFPEIFRAGMQRGANVIVVIANRPSPRVEHWSTLLRARAIENQAYVLGVNRCGSDPFLPDPGRSAISDFRGQALAEAGDAELVIAADADVEALTSYRQQLPFLADAKRNLAKLYA